MASEVDRLNRTLMLAENGHFMNVIVVDLT
jgi:hypothetical protein